MVKVENFADNGNCSDVEVEDRTMSKVGPSGLKPSTGPGLTKERSLPSSSRGHLKSYFSGMGFSPTLVDKVIEENGEEDADLLLETLFTYSALQKSSPEASNSLDSLSSSDWEENNSPMKLTTQGNPEIEDLDGHANVDIDKKTSLLTMNFSEEEVDLAISRLGERASLTELVEFIVAAQTAGSSGEKEMNDSINDSVKTEETTAETLFGTMDKTLHLLEMGFSEDEISLAIENFGEEVPLWELADSIFANRFSHRAVKDKSADRVVKEEDLSEGSNISLQNQKQSRCLGHATEERLKRCYPETELWETKASSLDATVHDFKETEKGKKAKCISVDDKTSFYSNGRQQARLKEWAFQSKSVPYNESGDLFEAKCCKVETPDEPTPNLCRNVHHFLAGPPYFLYANFVDVSQETWKKFSQFLYGIEPEYVNSQFFSAFNRKEGYFHNLPTEKRFHILPKPPMTIEDALPHTKKWWPSWDTRKQLSSISSETTGVARLCERLGKMMMDSQGMLSKEQQRDTLHHCKALNLIWVGQHKLSPIEADQVECILGYPMQHTEMWGLEPSDRLKALKYCFQTDTLGYHLSVMKGIYPDGLKVLSIYSGIGGAEVALHRLGIKLKCVVSVEASEINRKILKKWWHKTGQSGELTQIEGIEKLTSQKVGSFIEEFGGFDIIIGGNPCAFASGSPIGDSSAGVDLNLFYEFVRVFQRVRSIMGGKR